MCFPPYLVIRSRGCAEGHCAASKSGFPGPSPRSAGDASRFEDHIGAHHPGWSEASRVPPPHSPQVIAQWPVAPTPRGEMGGGWVRGQKKKFERLKSASHLGPL